jgi:hypothetical protein
MAGQERSGMVTGVDINQSLLVVAGCVWLVVFILNMFT